MPYRNTKITRTYSVVYTSRGYYVGYGLSFHSDNSFIHLEGVWGIDQDQGVREERAVELAVNPEVASIHTHMWYGPRVELPRIRVLMAFQCTPEASKFWEHYGGSQ